MGHVNLPGNVDPSRFSPTSHVESSISKIINMEGHVVTSKVRASLPQLDQQVGELFSTVQRMMQNDQLLSKSEIKELKAFIGKITASLPKNILLPTYRSVAASIRGNIAKLSIILDKKDANTTFETANPQANKLYLEVLLKEGNEEAALNFIQKNPNPSERAVGYSLLLQAGGITLGLALKDIAKMTLSDVSLLQKEMDKFPDDSNIKLALTQIPGSLFEGHSIEAAGKFISNIQDPEIRLKAYRQLVLAPGAQEAIKKMPESEDKTELLKLSTQKRTYSDLEIGQKVIGLRLELLHLTESPKPSAEDLSRWMGRYSSLVAEHPQCASTDDVKKWVDLAGTVKERREVVDQFGELKKVETNSFFGLASVPLDVQMAMINHGDRDHLVRTFPEMEKNYHNEIKSPIDAITAKVVKNCCAKLEVNSDDGSSKLEPTITRILAKVDINSIDVKGINSEIVKSVRDDVIKYIEEDLKKRDVPVSEGDKKRIENIINAIEINNLESSVKNKYVPMIRMQLINDLKEALNPLIESILTAHSDKDPKIATSLQSEGLKDVIGENLRQDYFRGLEGVHVFCDTNKSEGKSELSIINVASDYQKLTLQYEKCDQMLNYIEKKDSQGELVLTANKDFEQLFEDVFSRKIGDTPVRDVKDAISNRIKNEIFPSMKLLVKDSVFYATDLNQLQKKRPELVLDKDKVSVDDTSLRKTVEPLNLMLERSEVTRDVEVGGQIMNQVSDLSMEDQSKVLQSCSFKVAKPQAALKEQFINIETSEKNAEVVNKSDKTFVRQSVLFKEKKVDENGDNVEVGLKTGRIETLVDVKKQLFTYSISFDN